MGTKLKEIVIKKEIQIPELKDRVLVVDSYNTMYQFLTTIRMSDGSPLMDSKGNVTSHLNGIFNRTLNLMQRGVKLAFVFDGKPPKLKTRERERRAEAKEKARKEYEIAKERKDLDNMKKYAARTSRLTRDMVEEAKKLISAMGLPVIQAPSEGEAQAAYIVNKGEAFAEVSQDFDCLMFSVPRMIRNLTISGKRKLPGKLSFTTISPEIIDLKENLNALGIDQDQLIALSMLVGTDFNPGGIKGIGPKNALKLVRENKDDFDSMFSKAGWEDHFDFPWKEVYDVISNMPTTDDYELKWTTPDADKVKEILVDEHDFSERRVNDVLEKLKSEKEKRSQTGLGDFV
ncbi:flap endonuclease-1 [Candidatus Woesearchaeota archaeon]|nr:flap endonuclease-1 [Candidatus Woesearchaeota archaeon]